MPPRRVMVRESILVTVGTRGVEARVSLRVAKFTITKRAKPCLDILFDFKLLARGLIKDARSPPETIGSRVPLPVTQGDDAFANARPVWGNRAGFATIRRWHRLCSSSGAVFCRGPWTDSQNEVERFARWSRTTQ